MSMSWREAIEKVLQEADRPLHYAEISEQVLSRGYYRTEGATPDATVNAQITTSIKYEGDKSPFVKVGRGIYALRSAESNITPTIAKVTNALPTSPAPEKAEPTAVTDIETDESVIRCLGMYWQRDMVVWRNDPRIFGKQQALSKPVDFGGQRGIYILYDHHTVVYVGRSVDRPLGRRLFEHTIDRLGSRWNRFSWFGLLDVTDDGKLVEVPPKVTLPTLISTLEALLIEALEPPQNRKRGDDFSVMEYIQDIDPELREREIQNTLRTIEQKLRGQS
ncbi:HTH domain-containing protein [Sulfurisoma sediminicola]|uniref:HB1/ASXL restriction endonuclease-like protein with HTH domain n=1 Tax=Sulfurisoma sediminicola TaxID=1381557 RepID=A0A497X9L0_9PROT|nr:HTH domain-containing protein [Sulfurisoma sediminicola]RLJ62813.1 HB1/ASXL restriction endonuclease-like protein with HTH domain [Sulfurisoma sediminicola]